MLTIKTVKQSDRPCGFCRVGDRHDLCPGGVLNGDQTTVILCGCTEHPPTLRCLNCGSREDVNGETWTCFDGDVCVRRIAAARKRALRDLYGADADGNPTRTLPSSEKPAKAAPKPKYGKCLCCGETTGGGLFKPGHDSKYLTAAVESIKGGKYTLADVQQLMSDQGISPALQAKLAKRVS